MFLGGAAVAWPLPLRAQQPAMPVIGFLNSGSAAARSEQIALFHRGLNDSGYIERQNVAIEYRWADDQYDRLPALAVDLVRRKVAVIVAAGGQVTPLAAKAATATIPIVFAAGGDPVRGGLVASLNRPGGNVTGVSFFTAVLHSKRLELLHEIVPQARLLGFLVNPNSLDSDTERQDVQEAARVLGKEIVVLSAGSVTDFDGAFAALVEAKAGALLFGSDPLFLNRRDQIIALAARYAIPAIYNTNEHTMSGGLMSYGDDLSAAFRDVGIYVGKILKGAKPADLPVLQPTKFAFVINLKTAKSLGLKVPEAFLLRADEVLE